jgi:hypothetical protein
MAQTRKRRRTKHRGNAAGMVESRGRTGRRPSDSEKKSPQNAADRRRNRMEQPPTWRSAFNRAGIATVIFAVLVLLVFKQTIYQAVALAGVMLLLYVPLTYYTDLWIHRRYLRKQALAKARAKEGAS